MESLIIHDALSFKASVITQSKATKKEQAFE